MQAFWTDTPYSVWFTYIGGENLSCSQPYFTSSWVNQVTDGPSMSWALMFVYAGLQDPCDFTPASSYISYNTQTAFYQGANDASNAVISLIGAGILSAPAPIAADLESFNGTTACINSANAYIWGWVVGINSNNDLSAVYGSTAGSYLNNYASLPNPPYFIWGAYADGNPNVFDMYGVSSGNWVLGQRHKQYVIGTSLTENGIRESPIDFDYTGGPVWYF